MNIVKEDGCLKIKVSELLEKLNEIEENYVKEKILSSSGQNSYIEEETVSDFIIGLLHSSGIEIEEMSSSKNIVIEASVKRFVEKDSVLDKDTFYSTGDVSEVSYVNE